MTRTKLCGITSASDRDAAVAAGADALGFVVDVPVETPRELTATDAATLVADVPPFVTTVLVTMPETPDDAATLVEEVNTDVVQVHGLDPAAVSDLAASTDARVVAATDLAGDHAAYAAAADAVLVDSTDADGAGGTGETHDWTRTRELVETLDVPVVLAGGLTPENVAEAVGTVGPFAVDVASGIEATPGEKDHDAMAAFVSATRGGEP
ncbi:phosphoribosylanthranilate isomerase [Halomarina oriensis]|uniref:N-(5'-phosphoribosyl)anthranilate isomerase n=1 Tax=Halomarina oriensis TaxID=671145 RepID=A0A6B0GHW5_9EURY|nr:phosphoribosylanthranilate isomerase [Halomarina oriensis]MWG34200.1 phosphoribosylanthranilate isomerase [Halomarina oriensis]